VRWNHSKAMSGDLRKRKRQTGGEENGGDE